MGDDLDNFIREQKAKLAADRNLYNGDQQDSRSNRRFRDEEDGLVIPGLRDSYSARMRKQKARNEEYNEFLRQLKETEQSKFSDRKPLPAAPEPARQNHVDQRPISPPPRRADLDRDLYDEYLREKEEDERRMERRRQIMRELEKENRKEREILSDKKLDEAAFQGGFKEPPPRRGDHQPNNRANSKSKDDNFSLPIKDRLSAQQRLREERNKEYNEFLRRKQAGQLGGRDVDDRPAPARKGWGTPTYEEILDDKRKEELQYRKNSEEVPGLAEYQLRPAVSDGFLNRSIDDDRYDILDRLYEDRKVRFRDDLLSRNRQPRTGLLDDDDWLDLSRLDRRRGRRDYDYEPGIQTVAARAPAPAQQQQTESSRRSQVKSAPAKDVSTGGASLPLGDISEEEKRRRKEEYRLELLRQMDEAARNKQKQRQDQNAPAPSDRMNFPDSYQPTVATSKVHAPPPVAPSFLPVRPLNAGGPAGISSYNSPLDDPYYFYGLQNSGTEPEIYQAPIVPPVSLVGLAPQPTAPVGGRRVGFTEFPTSTGPPTSSRTPRKSPEVVLPGVLPSHTEQEQALKKRQEAQAYQQELERQIQENNRIKEKKRLDRERYEQKLEEEIMNYNPYGRGGGGAPMKDQTGNVVADLRQIHVENEEKLADPRKRVASLEQPVQLALSPRTAVAREPNDHARGGHGIFGDPKTDAEKSAIDRYKDELKKQIEEKKRVEEEKRLLEKLEEEKELKRIEEERLKIAREYEAEQRKLREKDDKIRLQNEEIKRQAEEKREELKRQQRDRDVVVKSRAEDIAKEERSPTRNHRTSSPIVPALRTRNETRVQSRADSADVLNQLANMRKQLQNERMRVESALGNQKYDVNVFDPRHVRAAPAVNQPIVPLALIYDPTTSIYPAAQPPNTYSITGRRSPDPQVFDTALQKGPVTVKRPAIEDKANAAAKAEFHRYRAKESTSKTGFRQIHPDSPVTGTALETQQLAFLDEQEEALRRLREGQPENAFYPQRAGSTKSQLQADSAFLDLNGVQVPTKNESAREKRRQARGKTPAPRKTPAPDAVSMGSTMSLDPDKLDRKNEERLKKLNDLAADDVSLASAEPDDIIDRFMSKQQYNRPPSESTLNDDEAWMRPSDK